MSFVSRRTLITRSLATAAGASGLAVAVRLASRYGLIPPDHGGTYAPGETLTYAAQRILTRHSIRGPSAVRRAPGREEDLGEGAPGRLARWGGISRRQPGPSLMSGEEMFSGIVFDAGWCGPMQIRSALSARDTRWRGLRQERPDAVGCAAAPSVRLL